VSAHPKDGGPAFPVGETKYVAECGMSLRDYFAAKAMVGLMTMCAGKAQDLRGADDCAQLAYEQADAMLKAREVQS
jgi:hypothetical protein